MRSTPKKLFSIARIHSKINNPEEKKEEKEKEVYIDQLI
nr:MAG TPA: hypothetical protein [Caudoviricetes sp.]